MLLHNRKHSLQILQAEFYIKKLFYALLLMQRLINQAICMQKARVFCNSREREKSFTFVELLFEILLGLTFLFYLLFKTFLFLRGVGPP